MTLRLQRVLLPTDFSEYSKAARNYAVELATRFDAELHVLHTLEHSYSLTPQFGMGLALPEQVTESKALAEKKLAEFSGPNTSCVKKIIFKVIDGSPKVDIVRYAREQDIDLIVISTHGRSGLAHIMIGSVAETIVRTAPCPVLTVRPKGHHFVMP